MHKAEPYATQPTKYKGRPVFSSVGGQTRGEVVAGALGGSTFAGCGNEANSLGGQGWHRTEAVQVVVEGVPYGFGGFW
jgi:hypothetical protein